MRARSRFGDLLAVGVAAAVCLGALARPVQASGEQSGVVLERVASRAALLESLHVRARLDPEGPARRLLAAPDDPAAIAAAVAAFAALGDGEGAVTALRLAVARGGADMVAALPTSQSDVLRADPQASRLLVSETTPVAAVPSDGAVAIEAAALDWLPALGLAQAHVAAAPPPRRPTARTATGAASTRADALLNGLIARGRAAGLAGVIYDNRDRGHSDAFAGRPPRAPLRAVYGDALRAANLDYGLNAALAFTGVVIGNSSTAVSAGPLSRSQPRLAMTTPGAALAAARLYASNHLYVYPAHRDHGPEHGDRFPALTPHVVISQGSSGSDRAFVRALADALAALRPDTRALAEAKGLIAPTLQMLLRRSMLGVETEADYLSGSAHPSAFDGARIDRERLVRLANGLAAEALPGAPALAVLAEEAPGYPVDAFSGLDAERLFDLPAAAARVALGPAPLRRYLLRASARDPNGRAATFRWSVLRGAGVALRAFGPGGETALVEAPWQNPTGAPGLPQIMTARVDVAVFADNGAVLSAPAIFSIDFTSGGRRLFDDAGRVLEIDYAAEVDPHLPADPLLSPLRSWRDVFEYGPDGTLAGWRRFESGLERSYWRDGGRVLSRDALGRPNRVVSVGYEVDPTGAVLGRLRLREIEEDRVFQVRYAGPDDAFGELVAETP